MFLGRTSQTEKKKKTMFQPESCHTNGVGGFKEEQRLEEIRLDISEDHVQLNFALKSS